MLADSFVARNPLLLLHSTVSGHYKDNYDTMKDIAMTRIIGIGVITIIVLTFSWYLIDRFSYSKELPFYSITVDNDTTLTIGIIGDSWVAGNKLDLYLTPINWRNSEKRFDCFC